MTTNRVKAFDPAILSRVHHAVNFEATTQQQEKKIWMNWIKLLQDRKLTKNMDEIMTWLKAILGRKSRLTLSGREIRNVFIQAQAIAAVEKEEKINIKAKHLSRAYEYRQSFRRDTHDQLIESQYLHAKASKQG